jgi:hypothetical protein
MQSPSFAKGQPLQGAGILFSAGLGGLPKRTYASESLKQWRTQGEAKEIPMRKRSQIIQP